MNSIQTQATSPPASVETKSVDQFLEQFRFAVAAYDNRLMKLFDQNRYIPAEEVAEEHLNGYGLPLDRLTRALEIYQRSSYADQEAVLKALAQEYAKAQPA